MYTRRRIDSADSTLVATMCYYTISRCGQCGCYREVVLSTCTNYRKIDPATPGVCAEHQTNDGFVDPRGVSAVICESQVPLPFVRICHRDGALHSLAPLHQVQELLTLCSRRPPQGHVTPRAADLGGFLFHLKFDANDLWAQPRRDGLGRYSADSCRRKPCCTAACVNCAETGTCGHHGPLREFKPYVDYRLSMLPLLMQHRRFLEEPDLVPIQIRTLYLGPALPLVPSLHLPSSELLSAAAAAATTQLVANVTSEPATQQRPRGSQQAPDPAPSVSSIAPTMDLFYPPHPTLLESSFEYC
jgi:hypothetical protein